MSSSEDSGYARWAKQEIEKYKVQIEALSHELIDKNNYIAVLRASPQGEDEAGQAGQASNELGSPKLASPDLVDKPEKTSKEMRIDFNLSGTETGYDDVFGINSGVRCAFETEDTQKMTFEELQRAVLVQQYILQKAQLGAKDKGAQ